jgi:diguanylate cyclase (GGDEF)-like protein
MFIDLDDFKTVNDTLGHAVGDELLRAVTVRLSACVREQDLVARLGGDEFAVLLRGRPRAEEAAVDVARRILDAFQTPVVVGGEDMRAGLSLGVATSDHSGDRTEDLMRDADVAMYEAKEAGKGRMAVFDPAMREVLMRRHGLREELQVAIDEGDLVVQYQPIVDIATGHTYAMEALVRWNHADRGRIPPGEFIPLAEETGLVVGLGRFVLDAACREAASWPAEPGIEAPVVQVNLSALELEDDGLVSAVTDALARTGLEPRRLVLEITETLLMQDAARAVARLNALRELGVQLALDDFGTGYSSLSYLRSLPLDMLKIAKPFVDSLAIDARDEAFVRLMVELADDIGLRVVAEGIETSEQLAVLRGLGCELGQGFLFAAPVDDVGPWVRAGVPRAS